jgi:plastocyanin
MSVTRRQPAIILIPLVAALFFFSVGRAAQLQAIVKDLRGQNVVDVVIVAASLGPTTTKNESATAVMDQIDKSFVPEILVVRAGTQVSFPNSDSVAHQVYSFSPAKRFALPLYRGRAHPPLLFDQPGVVVLGCNIHDQMVGYIYVTASPYFGKTDEHGQVMLSALPAGTYRVNAWHPRADEEIAEQELKIVDAEPAQVSFRLQRPLRPKPRQAENRIRGY